MLNPVWGILALGALVAVLWYLARSSGRSISVVTLRRKRVKLATCRRCGDTYLPDTETPVDDERERDLCHVCRGEVVRKCIHCGAIFFIPPSFQSSSLAESYICRSCRAKVALDEPTYDPAANIPSPSSLPQLPPLPQPPTTPIIPSIDEARRGVVPLRLYELQRAIDRGDYTDYPRQNHREGFRAMLAEDLDRFGRLPADDRRIPRQYLPPIDRNERER